MNLSSTGSSTASCGARYAAAVGLRDELGLTGAKYGCGIGVAESAPCISMAPRRSLQAFRLPRRRRESHHHRGLSGTERCTPFNRLGSTPESPNAVIATRHDHGGGRAAADNPHLTEKNLPPQWPVHCRCGTYPRVMRAFRALVSR